MNKSLSFSLVLLLFLSLSSACHRQTLVLNDTKPAMPNQSEMQHFFIGGLAPQNQMIKAAEVCGGKEKIAKVETVYTFIDGLVAFLTLSIYTPRTVKIYCVN